MPELCIQELYTVSEEPPFFLRDWEKITNKYIASAGGGGDQKVFRNVV